MSKNDIFSEGSSDTVNGWKDIAVFLGKSVRSVQRWERDLGLPVHRINTPDRGQIVYASRAEIEAWRRQMESAPPGVAGADVAPPEEPSAARDDSASVAEGSRVRHPPAAAMTTYLATSLLVLAALGVGVLIGWRLARPAAPGVARLEYNGTEIRGLSADGRIQWRHDFGELVSPPPGVEPVMTDLDADGAAEFIGAVRAGGFNTKRPPRSDRVVCFRNDGTVLWSIDPAYHVAAGDRSVDAPWHVRALASGGSAADGRSWIALVHHTWSPSLVVEVSVTGTPELRFVQSGWIVSLAYWPTPEGPVLAAGGVSHEHERAALALLDLHAGAARAPASSGHAAQCESCPTGHPLAYLLVPSTELTAARGQGYTLVSTLSVEGPSLKFRTDDNQVGFVSADRRVVDLELADTYWAAHRLAEEEHAIMHDAEKCPALAAKRPVRIWTAEHGWTDLDIPPASTGVPER